MTFRQYVFTQFNKTSFNEKNSSNLNKDKDKKTNIFRVSPLISLRSSKSILVKSKFFKKNTPVNSNLQNNKQLYTQMFKSNIKKIFKIKDTFSKLFLNKVSKIISKSSQKGKLKINMMTKNLSRKQIIIFMGLNNIERVIVQSNIYIANINR